MLDLQLTQRHLRLEAQVERALLARGAAGDAAGEGAEDDRELPGGAVGDEVVLHESRDRPENRPEDDTADRPIAHNRPRLREEVLGVLLDDRFVEARHSSLIGGPAPALEPYLRNPSSTLIYVLSSLGTLTADPLGNQEKAQ